MTKNIKVVLWDKVNDTPCNVFSNPPLGLHIDIDLENRTMTYYCDGGVKTVADITKGDIFEIRVMQGIE